MKKFLILFFITASVSAANLFSAKEAPPIAKIKPYRLEKHGDVRMDNYYWLNDNKNKDVMHYLKSENKYFKDMFKPLEPLKKELISEMRSRIAEEETTYPLRDGEYLYFSRFEKNKQYPIYLRKSAQAPKPKEEVIFDINKLAAGNGFFQARYKISPNSNLAALIFDKTGRRFYNVKFKDLKTGRFFKNEIKNVTDELAWASDSEHVIYTKQDPKTLRHDKVFTYNLRTGKEKLVYFEKDETFDVYIGESLIKKHVFIHIASTLTSEIQVINAANPEAAPRMLWAREKGVEVNASEDENYFYLLTNKGAENFKLLKLPINEVDAAKATELIAHRPQVYIENFIAFKNKLILASRENGLSQLEVFDKKDNSIKKITFPDESYFVELGANTEYDSVYFRYNYESMKAPPTIYDYDLASGTSILRKVKNVPDYNQDNYETHRIFITARDGAKVPVSLLMKKGFKQDASASLLLDGYGSYGLNNEPLFSPEIFSLVDRGFVFGFAHIRGGAEMGRAWKDGARVLTKKNTFYDFLDVTDYLVQNKYVNSKSLFAQGESAGGLLIGFISNNRPELFKGLIADVPFVDALTTMLDDSIPLTTAEYDEWGNPNEKIYYDYIKSYSPYDNVKEQAYPNLLVITAFQDSQVQYWEPAKWVAKLRQNNKKGGLILMNTELGAGGHSGQPGRYDHLKEVSDKFSFILGL